MIWQSISCNHSTYDKIESTQQIFLSVYRIGVLCMFSRCSILTFAVIRRVLLLLIVGAQDLLLRLRGPRRLRGRRRGRRGRRDTRRGFLLRLRPADDKTRRRYKCVPQVAFGLSRRWLTVWAASVTQTRITTSDISYLSISFFFSFFLCQQWKYGWLTGGAQQGSQP